MQEARQRKTTIGVQQERKHLGSPEPHRFPLPGVVPLATDVLSNQRPTDDEIATF